MLRLVAKVRFVEKVVKSMKSERKHYLDNIRWLTVVIVVLYHVIYMYSEIDNPGVVGKITNLDVQYYDVFHGL